MELEVRKNLVLLSGFLNEKTELEPLAGAIEQAHAASPNGRVLMDFSPITMANSIGILYYLKFLKAKNPPPITYLRVPPWLVEQLGQLKELLEGDVQIESIMARFYCTENDGSTTEILELGKDVPILPTYADFRPTVMKDGKSFEADFDPEVFFLFIANNYEKFLKQYPKSRPA